MKNVSIKRKPMLVPSIPECPAKYKELHYEECNLKELYLNEISKLNEDDLSTLKNVDCYEIFYYESHYDKSSGNPANLSFKGVDVKVIVEELATLAEKFPNFYLKGGSLTFYENDQESEILKINISNGQVEVLV